MEVKINKEIREYTESVFMGLSMRQSIFSVLACGSAVGVYFLAKPYLGTEIVSWLCIFAAIPFVGFGFVKYNGMFFERLIIEWFKSTFLIPKQLVFRSENLYYEAMKPVREQKKKEARKKSW